VLNYIDSPIVPPFFAVFMAVWAYLRHYVNLKILYSILTEFATVGNFTLNWDTQQYKCWISQYITFALLAALQAVNLFWWFYICRIAYRIAVLNIQEDDRSEYEPSEDEGEGNEQTKQKSYASAVKENVNGVNGTPKVLVNGQEPKTPESNAAANDENGTIGSRLRERKSRKA
jgi:acyl-CoA-dependent ceramide synthase